MLALGYAVIIGSGATALLVIVHQLVIHWDRIRKALDRP